ncbi:hypothetical protein KJZ63_04160 [Patescibacteria group bacterium]|nr:hypothetical protein [Patescibacteria group bacterium]
MPIYVRIVKDKKWLCESEVKNDKVEFDWLKDRDEDSVPCQIVDGVNQLTKSSMSLYLLPDESHLNRLAAAWAIHRSSVEGIKFVYVDAEIIESLPLKICPEKGLFENNDNQVNEWHRSIIEMDTNELNTVIKILYKGKPKLTAEPVVLANIMNAVKKGWVKKNKLPKNLQKSLITFPA